LLKKKNNSDPELCSGISIALYVKYLSTVHHHQYE
jgi:hypothetical protein